MKIDTNITLDDFKSEMQHRVVRYSPRSMAVRQALRFARQHKDPEFFRVATNKILAQKQFHREMYGPGWFERIFDYFSLGSLREVVVTVLLVGLGVLGIDYGKRMIGQISPPSQLERMEIDQLAKRLGFQVDDSGRDQNLLKYPMLSLRAGKRMGNESVNGSAENDTRQLGGKEQSNEQIAAHGSAQTKVDSLSSLSNEDIQRISEAVITALKIRETNKPSDPKVLETLSMVAPQRDDSLSVPTQSAVDPEQGNNP
jgi:hypothetical protein